MRTESRLCWALVVVGSLAASCSDAGTQGGEQIATNGTPGIDWETFRAQSVSTTPNGMFIVEGDMLFSDEEQVYRYWIDRKKAPAHSPPANE